MAKLLSLRPATGLWIACLLSGVLVLLSSLLNILPSKANSVYQGRYEPANNAELLSRPNAVKVKVGAFIENYHDLSLSNRRFQAEGYYWLEWSQALQEKIEQLDIKPMELLEITNQIDEWDSRFSSVTEEPTKLPSGNYYYQVRFSGNFYIPDLNLRRSPFESVKLPIIIEVLDSNFALENFPVVLTNDNSKDALVGSYGNIDGFKLATVRMNPMEHSYGTDWGLGNGNLDFSAMEVEAVLRTSPVASLVIWILPVLIVIGIVLIAPSLSGEYTDTRLAIPSTGLLTLIFLQQTYRATVPALDYLTFLDWLYACGYLISIITFLLFLWGTNVYQSANECDKSNALMRIDKIDSVFQLSALLVLMLASALAWWA